jgi:hypothetical protein
MTDWHLGKFFPEQFFRELSGVELFRRIVRGRIDPGRTDSNSFTKIRLWFHLHHYLQDLLCCEKLTAVDLAFFLLSALFFPWRFVSSFLVLSTYLSSGSCLSVISFNFSFLFRYFFISCRRNVLWSPAPSVVQFQKLWRWFPFCCSRFFYFCITSKHDLKIIYKKLTKNHLYFHSSCLKGAWNLYERSG